MAEGSLGCLGADCGTSAAGAAAAFAAPSSSPSPSRSNSSPVSAGNRTGSGLGSRAWPRRVAVFVHASLHPVVTHPGLHPADGLLLHEYHAAAAGTTGARKRHQPTTLQADMPSRSSSLSALKKEFGSKTLDLLRFAQLDRGHRRGELFRLALCLDPPRLLVLLLHLLGRLLRLLLLPV